MVIAMAFRDFSFPQVATDLQLQIRDGILFPNLEPLSVQEWFAAFLQDGVTLALANSTEKARSEFIIAPVLLELRRTLRNCFELFSGVEWDVERERGLNGYCDFLLTHSGSQHVLGAPFAAVVEAKNDLIRTGLGQCIAAMVAAQVANQRAGLAERPVYGVVSTGATWKFLRLVGSEVTIDEPEFFIDNLPRLMGALRAIVTRSV